MMPVWQRVQVLIGYRRRTEQVIASVLEALNLQRLQPKDRIGGVGGLADSVDVQTPIRFTGGG